MTDTFQVGDVVRLKSGGPKMTVTQVGTEQLSDLPTVWCTWFDSTKQVSGTFPIGAVEAATEAPLPRVNTGRRAQF